jgi:hypothetical protein
MAWKSRRWPIGGRGGVVAIALPTTWAAEGIMAYEHVALFGEPP